MIYTLEDQIGTICLPVFGTEIFPIVHPDPDGLIASVSSLYAVYTIIGGKNFNTLSGDVDLSRVKVQFSIYSLDYSDLKVKQRLLNAAMKTANASASACVDNQIDCFTVSGALPNVAASVPIEGQEADTRRFYSHSDFYCWAIN